jgi:hypothetical protein
MIATVKPKVSREVSAYMSMIGKVGGPKASSMDKSRAGKLGAAARMRVLANRNKQVTTKN